MTRPVFLIGNDCVRRDGLDALRGRAGGKAKITPASRARAFERLGIAASGRDFMARWLVPASGCIFAAIYGIETRSGEFREISNGFATDVQFLDCCTASRRWPTSFDSYAQLRE